jgi:hypothetical protein
MSYGFRIRNVFVRRTLDYILYNTIRLLEIHMTETDLFLINILLILFFDYLAKLFQTAKVMLRRIVDVL